MKTARRSKMAKKLFSVIAIGFFYIWALTAQNALPAYGNAAAKY
jgi:hypothetical protein